MKRAALIASGMLLGMSAAQAADATSGPAKLTAADSFALMTLDFCAEVAARKSESVPDIASGVAGLRLTGPTPIFEQGKWSEGLQDQLHSTADIPVYRAATLASRIGSFHLAFARVDGKECTVLAQQIPNVTAKLLERLAASPDYRVMEESPGVRIYGRAGSDTRAGHIVVVPRVVDKRGVTSVSVSRFNVRREVTAAAREQMVDTVTRACLASVRERRVVQVAEFGEWLEERPAPSGNGTNLEARDGWPATLLLRKEAPKFGCQMVLSAGTRENAAVVSALREKLAAASLQGRRTGADAEEFTAATSPTGAGSAVVALRSLSNGMLYSITFEAR
jgi:hypothetical protein